jgi:release factor glutamine methyltransferase
MLIQDALEQAAITLTKAGVISPSVDAQWLMAHVKKIGRGDLGVLIAIQQELLIEHETLFFELIDIRAKRIPLQHITGVAGFRSLELQVGKGVFIPRPETEMVVQYAIDFLRTLPHGGKAIDLGTGSGAIALAMATEVPNIAVTAVEKSAEAAFFARKNIAKYAPEVELVIGSMSEVCAGLPAEFDVLVSNPPYIPVSAIPIDPEVRDHDPQLALYGGVDGLDVIREISEIGLRILRPGGFLVLEHADGQSELVRELLLSAGWRLVSPHKDANFRFRTVTAVR